MKMPKKPKLAKMPKRPKASASTASWEKWKSRCDETCKKNAQKIKDYKKKVSSIQSAAKKKEQIMKYSPKCVTFK